MKKIVSIIALLFISVYAYSQCSNNTSSYGSATASATAGTTVTISTCNYQTEFSTVSGFVAGNNYTLTYSLGGCITVHSGSGTGPVVAFGTTPLSFTPVTSGTYYISYNTNCTTCGTASSCGTSTVVTNTAAPPAGCIGGSNNSCATADPFCTGTAYNYCNSTGVASMGSYGCLISTPNPMWMYLNIATSGNIDILIEQFTTAGTGIDVDFALYGPFGSLAAACPITTSSTPIDCSFSTSYTETANITGATVGQYYMILITNYNGATGYIEFSQTGGAGATNCNIVVPCAATAVGTNPLCNTGTGSILVTGTGGTPPYNVSWSGTSSGNPGGNEIAATGGTYTIPALAAGNYTVTVSDGTACQTTHPITITAPAAVTASEVHVAPACFGGTTTSTITANGGTAPYNISWSGTTSGNPAGNEIAAAGGTYNMNGLAVGTYNVTVTDANSCTGTVTVTITQPAQVTASDVETNTTCFGGTNGNGAVTANGGTAPYNVSWSGTASGNPAGVEIAASGGTYNMANLAAGTYTVTVTDAGGCAANTTVNIANGPAITSAFTTSANQCLEGNAFDFINTGSVGGSITISYTITAPSGAVAVLPGPDVIGAVANEAGTWTIVQTTQDGSCSDTETHTVIAYSEPVLTLTPTNVTCNHLNDGPGSNDGVITGSTTNANGAVNYTIISGTGSFTSNVASGLTAGTYQVVVQDAVGCNDTSSVTLTEPAAVILNLTSTSNPCNGDCVGTANVVSVTGGVGPFTYNWGAYGTTQNISGLCAGTYNVTVYDTNTPLNACYEIGSQTINEPVAETYTNSATTANCGLATGSATINVTTIPASATYAYTWYSDAGLTTQIANTPASASTTNTLNAVAAGTYYVRVVNANGCDDVIAVTVSDNGSPTLTVTSSTNISCNGGNNGQISVSLGGTLNPNYTYTWELNGNPYIVVPSTPSNTDSQINLVAGTYDLSVSDAAGCMVTANVILTQPTAISGAITVTNANCATPGALTINAMGGTVATSYDYDWNNDAIGDFDDLQTVNVTAGSYSVVVRDDNNCLFTVGATVTDIGGIGATASVNNHVSCFGGSNGSVSAAPTGGVGPYIYDWLPNGFVGDGTATYSSLPQGTYQVTVTDANGCSANTSITVNQPTQVTVALFDSTMVSCYNGTDGSITVTAAGGTGGYTYQWDLAAGLQTTAAAINLADGCYSVTVKDANLCTASTTICIHEPTQLIASVVDVDAHCNMPDGTAHVNISGGTGPYPTISWSGGAVGGTTQDRTGLAFGTYTVTVGDSEGCSTTVNFTVDSLARGTISVSNVVNVDCFGNSTGSVQVSVGGGGGSNTYDWTPNGFTGEGTHTYSNLTSGTYSVIATDTWGCTLNISQNITEPLQLTVNMSDVDDRCAGTCEGTATATPTGGTAPYSYDWDNATLSTTPGLTNLCQGTYHVTVEDAHHCTVLGNVVITEPLPISFTAVIDSSSCSQYNGEIHVNMINGIAPFTFVWSSAPVSTGDSLVGIAQGSYSVTATDFKGCPADSSFIVVDQNSPTVLIDSIVHPSCNGFNDGEVYASCTGGVLPYIWQWNSDSVAVASVSNIATNLDGGQVCVTVTDVNGCGTTACTTLVENPALNVVINTTDVLCNGDSTGTATATVTGGTGLGTYTYQWTGLYNGLTPTSNANTGLPSGVYSFLATDANACTFLVNNILIQEPLHLSILSGMTEAACYGEDNGTAWVNVSGGTTPYTYIWPDGQSNDTAVGLSAGVYHPTVTDAYGCSDNTTITVTQPSDFTLDSVVVRHITCYGSGDGEIATYVHGGVLNYTFTYSGPSGYTANTQGVSGLTLAGNYNIHVVDSNGCDINTSVIINQPPQLLTSATYTHESCYGYNNGSIDVSTVGGSGSNIYAWSDIGVATQDRTNLSPGTYVYTITDAHGCFVIDTVVINGNQLLDLYVANSSDIQNATCGQCDGAATLSLVGGIAPYQIQWFGGVFSSCTPATPYPSGGNSLMQTGLSQGIHSAFVQDGNGCRDTVQLVINNLTGPTIDNVVVNDVLCAGGNTGNIQVTVSGGSNPLTYSWSDNGLTGSTLTQGVLNQINLYDGTYYFSVTDANLCVASTIIEVDENQALTVLVNNIIDARCYGEANGSATMQGFGGTGAGTYTYHWTTTPNQSSVTASNIAAGTYIASLSDANGCSATQNFTIDQPNEITLSNQIVSSTTCAQPQICDGSIQVAAAGGNSIVYNYNWFGNGPNQNIVGTLCAGNVQLEVTDILGCSGIFNFTVNEPPIIHVSLGQDPVACSDPNGLVWIQSISGGTAAPYSNGYGDHRDNTYPLTNGWECTWDVGGIQRAYLDNVYNQYYQVQVFDPANHQCAVTAGITVGSIPEPYLFSQNTIATSCNGVDDGQVRIEVKQGTPDFSYSWSFNSNVPFATASDTVWITNIPAGTYNLTVTDANGCVVPTTFIIFEPTPLTVTATQVPNGSICINQNVMVYANGAGGTPPYEYDWTNAANWINQASQLLSPINDTLVYVNIRDSRNCPASTQTFISVYDSLQVQAIVDGSICQGESYTLDVILNTGGNGAYQYTWSDGSTLANHPVSPGSDATYYVTLSDNCGSPRVVDTVQVMVHPNPYVYNISKKDSCEPLGMVFFPTPEDNNANYTWDFGDPASGSQNTAIGMYPSHLFHNSGSYDISLHLSSAYGCTYDTTFENWIVVHPLPEADFTMNPNPASLFNNVVRFYDLTQSEDAISTIHWTFGNGEQLSYPYMGVNPQSEYDQPGYYDVMLTATTIHQCKDTISRVLRVNDEYTLYAPNAFTPGEDGRNDYFYPLGHGLDSTKTFEFVIYDRWGEEIYKTTVMPKGMNHRSQDIDNTLFENEEVGWNGRYNNTGEFVQNDVYTWQIKLMDVNGVSHEMSGMVNVIR